MVAAGARASMAEVVAVAVVAAASVVAGAGGPQGPPLGTMAEVSRWKVSFACIFHVLCSGSMPATGIAAQDAAWYCGGQLCCRCRIVGFKCGKSCLRPPCQYHVALAAEQQLPLI